MPELPEVETVRKGLEPVLTGARLTRVETRRSDLRFPLPVDFVQRLTGARIDGLRRRGKYLLADLASGGSLLMHLGMTGRFQVDGAPWPPDTAIAAPAEQRHAHILFETDAGARITYFDARRFGFMDFVEPGQIHSRLAGLGPEPLGGAVDGRFLANAFAGRLQSVKTLLLDQRIVAGLGNIYACEALHRARVSPRRAAGRVSIRRLQALADSIDEVLSEAIAKGGSTLRDFAAADGQLGYFQHSFRVYDRTGQACVTPDCRGVVQRIVQSGRSSFYCPACQR